MEVSLKNSALGAIAELEMLKQENAHLRAEIQFLRSNPTIARGLKGESLLAESLSARRARPGAGHDLKTLSGQLIEVKYSSLLKIVGTRPIRRWVWTKLFGELGNKRYDRLLLIGDADPRHSNFYIDPQSPYVFFDLPYLDAVDILGGIRPGRLSKIHLTTNPSTVKSWRAKVLFKEHQVSIRELRLRYPALKSLTQPAL